MRGRVIQTPPELELLLQKSSELVGIRTLFVHSRPIRVCQIVVVVIINHTRDDMRMVMPRILSTRRFVVLTNGYAIAHIRAFESNGDLARKIKDSASLPVR